MKQKIIQLSSIAILLIWILVGQVVSQSAIKQKESFITTNDSLSFKVTDIFEKGSLSASKFSTDHPAAQIYDSSTILYTHQLPHSVKNVIKVSESQYLCTQNDQDQDNIILVDIDFKNHSNTQVDALTNYNEQLKKYDGCQNPIIYGGRVFTICRKKTSGEASVIEPSGSESNSDSTTIVSPIVDDSSSESSKAPKKIKKKKKTSSSSSSSSTSFSQTHEKSSSSSSASCSSSSPKKRILQTQTNSNSSSFYIIQFPLSDIKNLKTSKVNIDNLVSDNIKILYSNESSTSKIPSKSLIISFLSKNNKINFSQLSYNSKSQEYSPSKKSIILKSKTTYLFNTLQVTSAPHNSLRILRINSNSSVDIVDLKLNFRKGRCSITEEFEIFRRYSETINSLSMDHTLKILMIQRRRTIAKICLSENEGHCLVYHGLYIGDPKSYQVKNYFHKNGFLVFNYFDKEKSQTGYSILAVSPSKLKKIPYIMPDVGNGQIFQQEDGPQIVNFYEDKIEFKVLIAPTVVVEASKIEGKQADVKIECQNYYLPVMGGMLVEDKGFQTSQRLKASITLKVNLVESEVGQEIEGLPEQIRSLNILNPGIYPIDIDTSNISGNLKRVTISSQMPGGKSDHPPSIKKQGEKVYYPRGQIIKIYNNFILERPPTKKNNKICYNLYCSSSRRFQKHHTSKKQLDCMNHVKQTLSKDYRVLDTYDFSDFLLVIYKVSIPLISPIGQKLTFSHQRGKSS